MKKVVVTGGSGHIGRAVADCLRASGHDVLSVDRRPPADPSVPHRVFDLLDAIALRDALSGAEVVCHLGEIPNAYSGPSPREIYTNNTQIASLVMETAVAAGAAHVIYTSSCQVYGFWGKMIEPLKPRYLPLDENHPLAPQNVYSASKAANEIYGRVLALQHGIAMTVFRFPAVPKTNDYPRWIERRAEWCIHRHPVETEWGTFLHVEDAAEAYRLAIEVRPPGFEAFHFVSDGILSHQSTCQAFAEAYPEAPLPADWPESAPPVSLGKALRLLGWRPRHNFRQDYLEAIARKEAALAAQTPAQA